MRWTVFGRTGITGIAVCLLTSGAFLAFAQEQAPHPWRKADTSAANSTATVNDAAADPAAAIDAPDPQAGPAQPASPQAWPDPRQQQGAQEAAPAPSAPQQLPPPANSQQGGAYPAPAPYPDSAYPSSQGGYAPQPQYGGQQQPYNPSAAYGNYSIPATLTIAPGTYITVRTDGWLSSDRNQAGEAFTATLAEPLIVNGVVVAERGQTVGGLVTEAKKAGRVEGTSRLGLKLTDITLADGQKADLQTSMTMRTGGTSAGRDAAAIGGTTALGAVVGGAVGWGGGAAIGAGVGAAAGIVGVLLTRGRPTIVYPESMLTFRVDAPAAIDTTHAPQAFRYADPGDYGQPADPRGMPPARMAGPCYGCAAQTPAPAPYYGPAYYPYYSPYPYYWGSGFSLFLGPGFYYHPRFYAGGLWMRRR